MVNRTTRTPGWLKQGTDGMLNMTETVLTNGRFNDLTLCRWLPTGQIAQRHSVKSSKSCCVINLKYARYSNSCAHHEPASEPGSMTLRKSGTGHCMIRYAMAAILSTSINGSARYAPKPPAPAEKTCLLRSAASARLEAFAPKTQVQGRSP